MEDLENKLIIFFRKMPEALSIYKKLEKKMVKCFENINIVVHKSQISFSNRYNFAFVSIRQMRGRLCVILSFGVNYKINDIRIFQAVEPYPNRWTHHVIIQNENEIDKKIMDWLKMAYDFSMNK
jgi:predicted transport protein